MAQSCKIVSIWAPHHLYGVNLSIFNPSSTLKSIEPEWEPVIFITGEFVIKFKRLHTIISNEEVAMAISALIDARFLSNSFTNVWSCDLVSITYDVRWFSELCMFPASWAGTAATLAERLSENSTGIDMIPLWWSAI